MEFIVCRAFNVPASEMVGKTDRHLHPTQRKKNSINISVLEVPQPNADADSDVDSAISINPAPAASPALVPAEPILVSAASSVYSLPAASTPPAVVHYEETKNETLSHPPKKQSRRDFMKQLASYPWISGPAPASSNMTSPPPSISISTMSSSKPAKKQSRRDFMAQMSAYPWISGTSEATSRAASAERRGMAQEKEKDQAVWMIPSLSGCV